MSPQYSVMPTLEKAMTGIGSFLLWVTPYQIPRTMAAASTREMADTKIFF